MKNFCPTMMLILSMCVLTAATKTNGDERREVVDKHRGPPAFSILDLNNDGQITLDEFSQHDIPHGSHDEIFSHIDNDQNGTIDERELFNHKPPPPHVRQL